MKNKLKTCASIVICGMPLINYCYVVLFWLAGSAALGQWVRPSINDPKDFFFGVPAGIEIVLMILSFSVWPLIFLLGYRRRKIAILAAAYFLCLAAAIVLFRMDTLQITTWIAD